MFPETFVQKWIDRLTVPGDAVLDPFSGRGTTALTAILGGRNAIAGDTNDVAYCLTKAKTQAPSLEQVSRRLRRLRHDFDRGEWLARTTEQSEFFRVAFAPRTLSQLLFLRERLRWKNSRTDCMVAALVLGSLHGESHISPSYLSNRMPRTISTKPDYSVRFWRRHRLVAPDRDTFDVVWRRARFRYESPLPVGRSTVIHSDFRRLPLLAAGWGQSVQCVITSPPYLDMTNFEEDQWLRLWFLGGPPYPTRNRISRDDRYAGRTGYWGFICDLWRSLGSVVGQKAHVVLRIGSLVETSAALKRALLGSARLSRRKVTLVSCSMSPIRNRQTRSFRPGSRGCLVETDFHFCMR